MKKKKLPLVIDGDILLRSIENKTRKATSKILGARHGKFILIEDPLYQVNERLSAALTGAVFCQYFNDGYLYLFYSKVLQALGDNLTMIEYPHRFEVETIRQHHRIRVNIETTFHYKELAKPLKATIVDISEGGCQLIAPSLLTLAKDMPCELTFVLPDSQSVEGLEAKIREIGFFKLKNSTRLGLQFIGPPEQLSKISSFARYCMFFRV